MSVGHQPYRPSPPHHAACSIDTLARRGPAHRLQCLASLCISRSALIGTRLRAGALSKRTVSRATWTFRLDPRLYEAPPRLNVLYLRHCPIDTNPVASTRRRKLCLRDTLASSHVSRIYFVELRMGRLPQPVQRIFTRCKAYLHRWMLYHLRP